MNPVGLDKNGIIEVREEDNAEDEDDIDGSTVIAIAPAASMVITPKGSSITPTRLILGKKVLQWRVHFRRNVLFIQLDSFN